MTAMTRQDMRDIVRDLLTRLKIGPQRWPIKDKQTHETEARYRQRREVEASLFLESFNKANESLLKYALRHYFEEKEAGNYLLELERIKNGQH
jgi:hypothetical protein